MRKLIAGLCLVLAMSPLALAQQVGASGGEPIKSGKRVTAKKPLTEKQLAHQQKMKDCSRQAADQKLKGPDRKQFMKTCLKS